VEPLLQITAEIMSSHQHCHLLLTTMLPRPYRQSTQLLSIINDFA